MQSTRIASICYRVFCPSSPRNCRGITNNAHHGMKSYLSWTLFTPYIFRCICVFHERREQIVSLQHCMQRALMNSNNLAQPACVRLRKTSKYYLWRRTKRNSRGFRVGLGRFRILFGDEGFYANAVRENTKLQPSMLYTREPMINICDACFRGIRNMLQKGEEINCNVNFSLFS